MRLNQRNSHSRLDNEKMTLADLWYNILLLTLMIMTLISTKTIRELEPSLAPASQPGPTIVGGVRCSVDSSGEVFIFIIIVIIITIIIREAIPREKCSFF